jgi:hypothetical protein
MYKHVSMITVRLSLETEEPLSAEELEELIHSLDYEFSSDYAKCSTQIEDADFIITNRVLK